MHPPHNPAAPSGPGKMRAIRYGDYGQPPRIEVTPIPLPGPGEVLIRVEAAAFNPLDVKLHSGQRRWYFDLAFPYTMGSDVAGTIEQVGAGVTGLSVGDPVIGWLPPLTGGAFAEYAVLSAGVCAARPGGMSAVVGAAIPTAAGTAWQALIDIAKVERGQTVLVHAGAGGVGGFAIQFAAARGAHVIATASGDGVALCRSLGAHHVIDYRVADFTKIVADCDVVLDPIGGTTQADSYRVLKRGGHLVSLVEAPEAAMLESFGVTGTRAYFKFESGQLESLIETVARDRLTVTIDSVVDFSDFASGLARQASGRARGKIVLGIS